MAWQVLSLGTVSGRFSPMVWSAITYYSRKQIEKIGLPIAAVMPTASSNAAPLAISVEEVTIPREWALTMVRLTPGVRPKSSALTVRRCTASLAGRERAPCMAYITVESLVWAVSSAG
jgi:hypothetical protein